MLRPKGSRWRIRGPLLLALVPGLLWGHITKIPDPGNAKANGAATSGGAGSGGAGGGYGGAAGSGARGGRSGKAMAPGVTGKGLAAYATGEDCPPSPSDPNFNPNQDPVYLSYGTMFLSVVDVPPLSAKGQSGNAALGFSRFYSSYSGYTGPLGANWTHNYNILLVNNNPNVTIRRWDGKQTTFAYNYGTGGYDSPPGESSKLTRSGDFYIWTLQHGTQYTFNFASGRLASLQDRDGNSLTFSFDASNNITNVADGVSRRIALVYSNNRIAQVIDPLNQTNFYAYSASGLLTNVSDTLGTRDGYAYDDANNPQAITRIVDARSNTHSYVYDVSGTVTTETNALSAVQAYTWDWANWNVTLTNYNGQFEFTDSFDSQGRQRSYTNSLGNIQYQLSATTGLLTNYVDLLGYQTTNIWDTNYCALLKTIDPLGYTNAWAYDATFVYVTRFTNAAGNVAKFAYDSHGNLTNYIDTANSTNRYRYNSYGNLTNMIDANGQTNTLAYDTYGNLTNVTDALNHTLSLKYDVLGQLTNTTDALSRTNALAWDARHRLSQVIDPAGKTNSFYYDGNGNLVRWTNELGYVTAKTYDALNRLTTVTLPDGGGYFLRYGYDNVGNLRQVTNALGNVSSLGYDANNRLTSMTNALSKAWSFAWNANDWRTQATDPNSHASQFGYDAGGRLTSWTNALQKAVSYQYNQLHRLTNIVDARNNALGFAYQDCCADRLTAIYYTSSDLEQFTYDPAGNLTNYANRAGETVRYYYDAANRLTGKAYVSALDVFTNAYDAANQLTNALWTMGSGYTNSQVTLGYDALGRVTNETQICGNNTGRTVSYEYYDDGRRKKLTYPDGTYFTYEYTANGWLQAVKESGSTAVVSYEYDAAGYRTKRTLANNTFTTYQYDAAGHLTNLVNKVIAGGATNTLSSYAYGYDAAGNRTWVKRSSGRGDVYTYDAIDQVTNVVYDATTPDGSPGAGTNKVGYAIDAAGNWTNVVRTVPGVSTNTTTYQVSSLNQYTNINGNRQWYDTKGNYWSDGSNTYVYDYENRLNVASVGGVTYTNAYDSFGRWIGRKRNALWTWYYYAGWQLIEERDRNGSSVAKYVYGAGLDEPVRMYRSSTNYYYLTDGLGNITEVTDGSGTLMEQYTYDVYGTPTVRDGSGTVLSSSAISNRWLFTGRDWDAGQQLYNYRYRIYSPALGRFMQTDPIREKGGNNIYNYVSNDPLSKFDPFGLDIWVIRDASGLIKHRWAVGNNANGTYWSSDFMPTATSYIGRINCRGKINYTSKDLVLDPKNLSSDFVIERHVVASQTATDFVRDYAENQSAQANQPRYDVCGNNCIDWANGLAWMANGRKIRELLEKIKNEKAQPE